MTLLGLILVFVVVGLVLWLINTYVPMDQKVKTLMNIAVVIVSGYLADKRLGTPGSIEPADTGPMIAW